MSPLNIFIRNNTSARLLVFTVSFIYSFSPVLAQNEKNIKPEIKEATIFLNKAQLTSTASVRVEPGDSQIILEGLPVSIDPASIQISGKGNFMIMGVKYEDNYLKPHEKSAIVLKLEDSVKFYQFQLNTFRDFEDVMRKEELMLVANQAIGGEQEALDADDLEYFANFFRKRLLDIRFQILKNQQDVRELEEKINALQLQINNYARQGNSSGRIIVSVSSKSKSDGSLDISYVVNNAAWVPMYDIRIKDSGSPVALSYKAKVYQNTGVDWSNVKLKLSTTNPSIGGMKPELSTWYLNIYDPEILSSKRKKLPSPVFHESQNHISKQNAYAISKERSVEPLQSVSDITESVETSLAAEFVINTPYTIPASIDGRVVDIQNIELPAQYKHYAVPKLNAAAYLVALISGYDDKNLISGDANVYFEGSFVGASYLDMNNTDDTLTVSLGRDNNVIVERVQLKEFKSKSFLGTNKKEDYAYEISIRNTKDSPIDLTIEDHIPVSQNSQIEVEVVDVSSATRDELTGMLEWKMNIPAAETKKVSYRYNVKYPKNKQVRGLR